MPSASRQARASCASQGEEKVSTVINCEYSGSVTGGILPGCDIPPLPLGLRKNQRSALRSPHLPGPPLPRGEEGERKPGMLLLCSPLSPWERGVRGVRASQGRTTVPPPHLTALH